MEMERGLELAALLRLGLGGVVSSATGLDARAPSMLDALVTRGALGRAQALAVRTYLQHHRAACRCGQTFLAPEEDASFACPACGVTHSRASGPRVAARSERLPTTGDRVGPLELLEPLGKGAYGQVFRARHIQLGRVSALKLLPGAAVNELRRKRFEREVEAQARLDHAGIVRVHATYEVGDALACEMELVDGESLRARLDRERRLPWRDAAALLSKVARAIDHAHEREVVHRDLKPENLLLRRADGEPLVADLGMARLTDQASSLTRTGAVVGTPLYVAPETVTSSEVGPGADIWALGAILHEALAGEPPFHGESLVGLLANICGGARRPLPADVPAPLARICDRALTRPVAERYARALDLALDLERAQRGERLGPAPRRPISLRRVAAPSLLAALLAAGAVALARLAPPEREPGAPSRTPAQRATALAAEAQSLEATDSRRALALARSATELAGDDATLALSMAELRQRLGDPAGLVAALDRLAPARARDPMFRLEHARALRAAGHDERALQALGDPVERRAALLAVTLLTELARPAEGLALLRAHVEGSAGTERYDLLVATGAAHLARGDLEEAVESFAQATDLAPGDAPAQLGLAECLLALGAFEHAQALAERWSAGANQRWGLLVRAGALACQGEGAEVRRLLAQAAASPVASFACLEGRRFAAALAAGRPDGRWARRLLREARRAAYLSAMANDYFATSERLAATAVELLPGSTSAWTSRALTDVVAVRNGGGARAAAARDALASARALAPVDSVASAIGGLLRGITEGVWDAATYPRDVAAIVDAEEAASGLVCPFFSAGALANTRLHFLHTANDPAAFALARACEGQGDTPLEVEKLRRSCMAVHARAGDAEAVARLRLLRTDPAAAFVRFAQEGQDPAALDRALEEQPWNAGLRVLRGELRCQKSGRANPAAAHDLTLAALQSPELMLQPLVDLVRKEVAGVADPGLVVRDPELLPFPEGSTRQERAATALVRAILLLPDVSVASAQGRRRLIRALALCERAEDLVCESPLPRAVLALAYARAGITFEGRLGAVGRVLGCPPSTLDLLRARVAGADDLSGHLARVRAEFVSDRSRAWWFARDLTGHARLFRTLGEEPPTTARFCADFLATWRPESPAVDEGGTISRGTDRVSGARLTQLHGLPALVPATAGGAIELTLSGSLYEADLLVEAEVTALHFDGATGRRTFRLEPRGRAQRHLVPLLDQAPGRTGERVAISASGGRVGLLRLVLTQPNSPDGPVDGYWGEFLAGRRRDLVRAFGPLTEQDMQRELSKQRPVAEALAEDFAKGHLDDAPVAFVAGAFKAVVGRPPTPDESALWVGALEAGWTRPEVAAAVALTADARRRWPV